MDLITLLRKLEKLESEFAKVYEQFSTRFDGAPEVSALFFRLSCEEKQHADLVGFQRRMIARKTGSPVDAGSLPDEVDRLLETVRQFGVDNPTPTMADAIAFAIEAKSSATKEIHCSMFPTARPELAQLMGALSAVSTDDRKHYNELSKLRAMVEPLAVNC